jgi:hypothetical protein
MEKNSPEIEMEKRNKEMYSGFSEGS